MSRLPIYTDSHFTEDEMACPCCGQMIIDPEFLFRLEALRRILNIPLLVTSGYRCAEYNIKIKGHPRSLHMKGIAVDIAIKDVKQGERLKKAAFICKFNAIGIYSKHIHLDMRPGFSGHFFTGSYN